MGFHRSPFLLINVVSLYLLRQLFTQLFHQEGYTHGTTFFYMGQRIMNHRCVGGARVNQINRHLFITHKVKQCGSRIYCKRCSYNYQNICVFNNSACQFKHRHIFSKKDNVRAKQRPILATLIKTLFPSFVNIIYEFRILLGTQLHQFSVKMQYSCRACLFVKIIYILSNHTNICPLL